MGTSFIKTLAAMTVLAGFGVAAQTTALAAAPVYPGCIEPSSWSECKNSPAVETTLSVRQVCLYKQPWEPWVCDKYPD
jgi:hypothetical protein